MMEKNKDIDDCLVAWREGRLVALPTETVYGLAAPVNNEELLKKIFSVKERPFFDPLIVHISNLEMAQRYSHNWGEAHDKLAQAFWPGPLTIVIKKSQEISSLITSGLNTVGLRMPQNDLSLELISRLGEGVAAPSANKFTKTSPTCVEHVRSQFKSEDVHILEDGPSMVGIESTIVILNEDKKTLTILRPGILTANELLVVLGSEYSVEYGKTAFESNQKEVVSAPGQFKSHYRPDFPLGFSITTLRIEDLSSQYPDCEFIELSIDPYVTARELYSTMRQPLGKGDNRKFFIIPSKISKLSAKEREIWEGILNRLTKAATFTLDD